MGAITAKKKLVSFRLSDNQQPNMMTFSDKRPNGISTANAGSFKSHNLGHDSRPLCQAHLNVNIEQCTIIICANIISEEQLDV